MKIGVCSYKNVLANVPTLQAASSHSHKFEEAKVNIYFLVYLPSSPTSTYHCQNEQMLNKYIIHDQQASLKTLYLLRDKLESELYNVERRSDLMLQLHNDRVTYMYQDGCDFETGESS
ncbi:unnamed protein product [Thelazia callipaeda]|uniref:DP domain-containing protein n=1 Tax=Thelazia callipaeda TaxID=103827 RepID=A0A0N5CMU1_THECL|nr:unnamed protein product [Thelazia callipaeda]